MTPAERGYRVLLWAFPGRFRARHGEALLTTVLESPDPGLPDALHLVASGLAQRFRLPSGRRPALVAAVLITLVLGAFGAAAGSWTAERTAMALPSAVSLLELADGLDRGDATGLDIGTLTTPGSGPILVAGQNDLAGGWQAGAAGHRFTAAGWHVEAATGGGFRATRGGITVDVSGGLQGSGFGYVSLSAWSAPGAALVPLGVAGTVLGLLTGWLAAAALAHRAVRGAFPRTTAAVAALALLVVAPAVVVLYGNLLRMLTAHRAGDGTAYTVHSAPSLLVLGCSFAGVLIGLSAVSLALTLRPAGPRAAQAA